MEDKLRELASLPPRESDDRAVALSAVDALRRELALVTRAGLVSVVFGKVGERRRELIHSLYLKSEYIRDLRTHFFKR